MNDIGVAVVGAAGWGRNVVRAFDRARGAALRWVCDLDRDLLHAVETRTTGVRFTTSFENVLADPTVRAVAIAVDAPNHYRLARVALDAGRHVFVEKPLTLSSGDAEELCVVAERRRLTLMVGHLLLYHPAVESIAHLIKRGDLGDVYYLHSQRVNLGIVRQSENAWWSLAPHDVAVSIHLFGSCPLTVSATGASYLQPEREIEDVVFAMLTFAGGRVAHLHVSWLDPDKKRSLTVVGTRKMLTFDETLSHEQLKVYEWAEAQPLVRARCAEGAAVRRGGAVSPLLPAREPLLSECEHFVACVAGQAMPRSDGRQGLAVVKVLEAGARSMRQGGTPVAVDAKERAEDDAERRFEPAVEGGHGVGSRGGHAGGNAGGDAGGNGGANG